VVFHDALRVGDRVRRHSTIAAIRRKQGRTGDLYFVEVEHELSTGRGMSVSERQTIVYRPEGSSAAPPGQAVLGGDAEVARIDMPEVRLFRYSSLTFNGHRIHYDHPYATGREGYAGLVVHGPLQATLLANAAARLAGGELSTFRFRAVSPLIAGGSASLRARAEREGIGCCLCNEEGGMTMQAEATVRAG
jgi:3-methylfumaryl-CoA hydratase